MSQIFISYRRSDSQDATGRIHDHLDMYFGPNVIFRDIDGIAPGKNFPAVLEDRLRDCRIAIAVIGPDWLTAKTADGKRRLDDEHDYVRREISTVLARNIPLIPVLVGKTSMPAGADLPSEIAPLAFIQAVQIPGDRGFHRGLLELVEQTHRESGIHYHDFPTTLRQCQRVGLVTIKGNFLDDVSVREEIREANELIVVMNDGRSWIDTNREILLDRLRHPARVTKVVLYHPASDFISILVRKNKKSREQQVAEIKGSVEILTASDSTPSSLMVKGHFGFNPFSLTMTENYAFVSPYFFNERGALPLFKFSSRAEGGLYHELRKDALKLLESAAPLGAGNFSDALKTST